MTDKDPAEVAADNLLKRNFAAHTYGEQRAVIVRTLREAYAAQATELASDMYANLKSGEPPPPLSPQILLKCDRTVRSWVIWAGLEMHGLHNEKVAQEAELATLQTIRDRAFDGDTNDLQNRMESREPLSLADQREVYEWLQEKEIILGDYDEKIVAQQTELATAKAEVERLSNLADEYHRQGHAAIKDAAAAKAELATLREQSPRDEAWDRMWAKKYPMCDKLASVGTQHGAIVEFLEWLESQGISLSRPDMTTKGLPRCWHLPICERDEVLVMTFFDIDRAALETERRAILAEAADQTKGGRDEQSS